MLQRNNNWTCPLTKNIGKFGDFFSSKCSQSENIFVKMGKLFALFDKNILNPTKFGENPSFSHFFYQCANSNPLELSHYF